jgi:hypothetical protein
MNYDALSNVSKTDRQILNTKTFIDLADQLQILFAKEGFELKSYDASQPLHFTSLAPELQEDQLFHLKNYFEVCSEVRAGGDRLTDSTVLVWKMLKKMGLRPTSGIMDKVADDQVIEFYNTSNIQTFRNLNFFAICSYNLDDLLSLPWWQLFKRDDEINRRLFESAAKVFSGEVQGDLAVQVPTHALEEINSPHLHKMMVDVNFISPLYFNEKIDQILVIEHALML